MSKTASGLCEPVCLLGPALALPARLQDFYNRSSVRDVPHEMLKGVALVLPADGSDGGASDP